MKKKLKGAVIGAAVGAGVAVVGIPVAVGAMGFTATGIAAGSVAAKMMSVAAIANGGGVAAGSTVAVLQSVGAAGVSLATKFGLTSLGAAIGTFLSRPFNGNGGGGGSSGGTSCDPEEDESSDEPQDNPGWMEKLGRRRRSRKQRAGGQVDTNGSSAGCTPGSSPSPNSSQPGWQDDSSCLPTPTGAVVACLDVKRKN